VLQHISSKKLKAKGEIAQLDNILKLINSNSDPQKNIDKYKLNIPDLDLKDIHIERLYERFNDLGDYKIKRSSKKN
jgi:hypothetical protein